MGKRPFSARKSKLDPFSEIVGVESDAVVAGKAKVSSETVRSFRVRRGIPALWRGEPSPAANAGPVKTPSKRTKKSGKRAFAGRRSQVHPYLNLLGTVPDSEIASMAGVTMQNVRAYRIRRGIEADWRSRTKTKSVAEVAAPLREVRDAADVPQQATRWAYRVNVEVGDENREFIVVGDSLSDAAIQAEGRLAERIPRARVLGIATLAEAL